MNRQFARRTGFTLVELLVVIGIIALLVAILLPTLSRARASAVKVACLSNLRQVGTGMVLYANDHDGTLPALRDWAMFGGNYPTGSTFWSTLVAPYLGIEGLEPGVYPSDPDLLRQLETAFFCGAFQQNDNGSTVGASRFVRGMGMSETLPGTAEVGAQWQRRYTTYPRLVKAVGFTTEWVVAGDSAFNQESLGHQADLNNGDLKTDYTRHPQSDREGDGGANFAYLDGHAAWVPESEIFRLANLPTTGPQRFVGWFHVPVGYEW